MEQVYIGVTERTWSTEIGQARVALWYPAHPAEPMPSYLNFYPARAARDAQPLPGRFPPVLLLCGTGGNRYIHSYLAESLANQGFWVFAPDLPALVPEIRRWQELWLRPLYVSEILSVMLRSEFSGWLDPSRLLCIGHSSGGYVGLLLAGAVPDFGRNEAFSGVRENLADQDFSVFQHIPLTALVLLDPAFSSVFATETLASVTTPTALFFSELEDAELRGKVSHYRAHLGNLCFSHGFTGAGHYVYCNVCPPLLTRMSPEICLDLRVKRTDIHRELVQLVGGFCSPWKNEGAQSKEASRGESALPARYQEARSGTAGNQGLALSRQHPRASRESEKEKTMEKLYITLINDNVFHSNLEELVSRTNATYWLLAGPHYQDRLASLPEWHHTIFSRVLEQEPFTSEALHERVQQELIGVHADKLVFLTNDESCELACIGLQRSFAGPIWKEEQVEPFIHKVRSKQSLARAGVRVPRYRQFDKQRFLAQRKAYCKELAEEIGFPMISKPVDRYASMDVRRLDNLYELYGWASWCTGPRDQNTYEVEEFIEGELFHCDSLVQRGQLIWSNACKNVNPCMDFASGRSIGAFTIPLEDENAIAVREFNAHIVKALNPPDGATHMECFRKADGELIFLEIAARPPGGDMVGIYNYCIGVDLDVVHLMLRAGEPYQLKLNEQLRYGGWAIHPKRAGQVKAIHLPPFHSKNRVKMNIALGERVNTRSKNIIEEPSAEFWLYSETYEDIDQDTRMLKELQLCEMER